ncbi:MAG: DUF1080 domain-containing protein [Mameliella sp.]|nr:DUF1080 domain-containing protein [Phaeodactylibacter sp.]NRA51642.1 DUF1080 domain-containing protein [Phaeodactylibacter sp.]
MNRLVLLCSITLFLYGCGASPAPEDEADTDKQEAPQPDNTLTEAEQAAGWLLLFDGESTDGWRAYNQDTIPSSWIAQDGMFLTDGSGGDVIFADQAFENFDLYLEWKIDKVGNSGIFYHVQEGEQYHALYENAPEYQLLDDIGFEQALLDNQYVGADYGMYVPKEDKPVKAAGEWNSSRIRFTPEKVSYWLNGEELLSFVPWSDDWEMRKEVGKWKSFPDYGVAKSGFIGLQDHGSKIWFKNMKIRPL